MNDFGCSLNLARHPHERKSRWQSHLLRVHISSDFKKIFCKIIFHFLRWNRFSEYFNFDKNFVAQWCFLNYEKILSIFKRSPTSFFCEKNSFVDWKDISEEKFHEKKEFCKKIIFLEKEIWVEINVPIRILQHKENFTILTLIMSEIRSAMKGKQMSSLTWDKTSMIRRLFFNNEFDNLDKQRFIAELRIQCRENQCFYALHEEITTSIRRVTLNYSHRYA